jgi:hypothetical protein
MHRKVTEPCSLVASTSTPQVDPLDIAYMFSPVMALDVDADSISQHRKNSALSVKKGQSTVLRRYAGVLFALFATFIYSLGNIGVKYTDITTPASL